MRKLAVCLLGILLWCGLQGQSSNVELISNVTVDEDCSDIWGYVDKNGIEYAVMGTQSTTRIYSLEDPANPVERAKIFGASSIWRDIKHYGDHIFAVADQGADGLLIIDMSEAPDTITHNFHMPVAETSNGNIELRQSHNIFIDDQGFAYLCGFNNTGVYIFDVKEDPFAPTFVSAIVQPYSHDVYVQGDYLYSSEFRSGHIGIYDVTDRANPVLRATQPTALSSSHNAWTSHDGNFLFTTDETGNAFVEAFDISDLDNIMPLDKFKPLATIGTGVIPHNTHYLGGFLYTSYYTDGIVITDVNRPSNMIQVGQYDTWPNDQQCGSGFCGDWGAYPFLPSGLLLVSDIEQGLFVFNPTIQKACYVEGIVKNKDDDSSVTGALITILSDDLNEGESDANGNFATGQATSGTFNVVVSHPAYVTDTVEVVLVNGEVVDLEVLLQPKASYQIGGKITVRDQSETLENAMISLVSEDLSFLLHTDENGDFAENITAGTYDIYIGKWGYRQFAIYDYTIDQSQSLNIQLVEGYEDDFILDMGWEESGFANVGKWERGVPIETFLFNQRSNVYADLSDDIGDQCYMTGNGGGTAGNDDVDGLETVLTSPIMALSNVENPILNYSIYFFNGTVNANPQDDSLVVSITNGQETIVLETLYDANGRENEWRDERAYELANFMDITDAMQLILSVVDGGQGHIVEGAIDGFSVKPGDGSPTDDIVFEQVGKAFPNPFDNQVNILLDEAYRTQLDSWNLQIVDVNGKLMQAQEIVPSYEGLIQLETTLTPGVYFITLSNVSKNISSTSRLIKL